jgi:2-dehydro-3-deoxygalactonokinase
VPAALIALDWGTTEARAWLLDAAGDVRERAEAPLGIMKVQGGAFADALCSLAGGWLDAEPGIPILASGMIGSRQGWVEAPYVPCPAGAADLAGRLAEAPGPGGRAVRIVPGVSFDPPEGVPDVMRGEETQIVGVPGAGRRLFVLPGTHSKWAEVEDGRIVRFRSFMTGEVFAVLSRHSILGRLMEGEEEDEGAFAEGLARGSAQRPGDGGLLAKLFGVRTLGLFGRLPGSAAASYLSGLLIGCEVAEGIAAFGAGATRVEVVGGARLSHLYGRALTAAGLEPRLHGEEAAARGLWAIAKAAGVL